MQETPATSMVKWYILPRITVPYPRVIRRRLTSEGPQKNVYLRKEQDNRDNP